LVLWLILQILVWFAVLIFVSKKYIRKFTDEYLKGKTFDLVGFAGASKNLDIIMGQLDISVRLHQIKQVVLVHHEECGAYGVESTPERHASDLKRQKPKFLPNGQA